MISDSLRRRLLRLTERAYTERINQIACGLGLTPYILSIHERLEVHLLDEMSVEIGGNRATFRLTTVTERDRLNGLAGEEKIISAIIDEIRPDDVVYDIGANIGTHSCLFGVNLDDGKVVAFEPHPSNARRLRENLNRNDINASVHEYALSDTSGVISMALDIGGVGQGKHSIVGSDRQKPQFEVTTTTADELIQTGTIPEPDVIKIDVEGAEQKVIQGLTRTLKRGSCRVIFCEIHPEQLSELNTSAEEVRRLLESNGYTVGVMGSRGTERFIRASRK